MTITTIPMRQNRSLYFSHCLGGRVAKCEEGKVGSPFTIIKALGIILDRHRSYEARLQKYRPGCQSDLMPAAQMKVSAEYESW